MNVLHHGYFTATIVMGIFWLCGLAYLLYHRVSGRHKSNDVTLGDFVAPCWALVGVFLPSVFLLSFWPYHEGGWMVGSFLLSFVLHGGAFAALCWRREKARILRHDPRFE